MSPFTQTLPAQAQDPQAWRQGRERYAVWVLELGTDAPSAAVMQRVRRVRQQLRPWIWWGERQAHITLQVCGFTQDSEAACQRSDDFGPQQRQAQLDALQALAPKRFTLEIGAPDSFASAAFLPVHDPHRALPALRQALALAHGEFRQGAWVPHLTLGLFRQAWPWAELAPVWQHASALEAQRLALPVQALSLVDYDARCLSGLLRVLWRQPLAF